MMEKEGDEIHVTICTAQAKQIKIKLKEFGFTDKTTELGFPCFVQVRRSGSLCIVEVLDNKSRLQQDTSDNIKAQQKSLEDRIYAKAI